MKFSIITPCHKTEYMKELEETILNQSYQDWEWIILLNNGASYQSNDPRIKIFKCPFESKSIGKLKKHAFGLGTGDVLVEVDSDDLLTLNCLDELRKAFADDSVGFVYSDNAKLSDSFTPYSSEHGWTWETFQYKDKPLIKMNSFKPTPSRIGYIWFAPDHVRAWRKSVYDEVGGHNEDLHVCDDHELVIRTYLKSKFFHIPKCLYIYRITGDNSWLQRNADIQRMTVDLYNQYIYQLAERYCDLNGLMKIDLCGGFSKPEGYISIDLDNGDIIADLNNGIPLPDNSVGLIRAHDALEHIKDKQQIMKEIHRVLAPNGMLLSMTPSTDGRGAFQDPTHVSFWNQNAFWYWIRPEQMKYINNKDIKFREFRLETFFPNDYCKQNNISYVKADLEVIK